MRMWMIPPALLCRKHLLGEHNELHMLAGSLLRGKSLEGFIRNGLLEPACLVPRHDALAGEMRARGFRHQSPLPDASALHEALTAYHPHVRNATVNVEESLHELQRRCPECRQRIEEYLPLYTPSLQRDSAS